MKLDSVNRKIKAIKIDDRQTKMRDEEVRSNPFEQFIDWFDHALLSSNVTVYDPCAMVLATIDEHGCPDTRIVLLKEVEENQLIFYSGYESKKALQLARHPEVAVNFYWPNDARQVRIKGTVQQLNREQSATYFASRPREAQLSAQAWKQSSVLNHRDELEAKIKIAEEKFANKPIPCPEGWGGYVITPFEYEFFQSQKWRRHDRFLYTLHQNSWKMMRLAP